MVIWLFEKSSTFLGKFIFNFNINILFFFKSQNQRLLSEIKNGKKSAFIVMVLVGNNS